MRGCSFRKILPIKVPKYHRRKSHVFLTRNFQHRQNSTIWNLVFTLPIQAMLRGKEPHKPEFVYDIVLIHSLMIYRDLIEYNIVGETKASLLRCFPFLSKLKAGDVTTTGEYINYQTFSHRPFRPLLKNSFQSIHIDLRDTSGEKHLLYLSVSLVLF